MQNEKSFDTGELTLKYLEAPSTNPPMVLLHGLTSNKMGWSPLLPELSKHWHVYTPDMRGHGKTGPAPDNQYHNADYARDIVALLKHIGAPAVLMGHSLGAMVCIVTAAQYPAGVRALVLLDPPLLTYTDPVTTSPEPAHWFELISFVMKDNPSRETIVARLRERMPDAPDDQINGMVSFMSEVAPGTTDVALRDEMWQGVDLPRVLQQITCPVLLIHGDWDRGGAMRAEDIASFQANCPSARVVHIAGADHGLMIQEDPGIVLEHVNAFLQSA